MLGLVIFMSLLIDTLELSNEYMSGSNALNTRVSEAIQSAKLWQVSYHINKAPITIFRIQYGFYWVFDMILLPLVLICGYTLFTHGILLWLVFIILLFMCVILMIARNTCMDLIRNHYFKTHKYTLVEPSKKMSK